VVCLTSNWQWQDNSDYNTAKMSLSPFRPQNVMLMPNTAFPKANILAHQVRSFLSNSNISVKTFNYDFESPGITPDLDGIDLLIVLGGDGSLLRAGHFCAPLGIPLLGIQTGRLGFLVELNENELEKSLEKLIRAEYRLESRLMLTAQLFSGNTLRYTWDVINEAVICRGKEVRPIEVRVDLNEGYMNSYVADGVIVATATGSTGYALAAGGPILPPELRNMLILPIAPHLSLDRAVVLAEGAEVNLYPTIKHDVVISIDGMDPVLLSEGDRIHILANQCSLHMVRFCEPNYFYRNLAAVMQRNPILKMENHD
jgi:NAD+ kinase